MDLLVAALPAFLASLVEAVEALTIILAVGVTRQWRSSLYGAFTGLIVLTGLIAIFGTAIVLFVPLNALRIVIGSLLLIYGLQWTTKAILRASGAKAKHDEELIYAKEVKRLREEAPVPATGIDGISFAVSFKGVLLEGLEVAFIVITFGTSAGHLGQAALGAVLAVVLVTIVGIFVHRPLSRVPENGLKFAVGLHAHHLRHLLGGGGHRPRMAGERSHPRPPADRLPPRRVGGDVGRPADPGASAPVEGHGPRHARHRPGRVGQPGRRGRRRDDRRGRPVRRSPGPDRRNHPMKYLRQFGRFLYDFLVGDAWELFVGPLVGLLVAWALVAVGLPAGIVGGILFAAVIVVATVHLTIALRGSA